MCANKLALAHLKIMLSTNYSLTNCIYIYIYIYDLALNNPQRLIYHKTQPNIQVICLSILNAM